MSTFQLFLNFCSFYKCKEIVFGRKPIWICVKFCWKEVSCQFLGRHSVVFIKHTGGVWINYVFRLFKNFYQIWRIKTQKKRGRCNRLIPFLGGLSFFVLYTAAHSKLLQHSWIPMQPRDRFSLVTNQRSLRTRQLATSNWRVKTWLQYVNKSGKWETSQTVTMNGDWTVLFLVIFLVRQGEQRWFWFLNKI